MLFYAANAYTDILSFKPATREIRRFRFRLIAVGTSSSSSSYQSICSRCMYVVTTATMDGHAARTYTTVPGVTQEWSNRVTSSIPHCVFLRFVIIYYMVSLCAAVLNSYPGYARFVTRSVHDTARCITATV